MKVAAIFSLALSLASANPFDLLQTNNLTSAPSGQYETKYANNVFIGGFVSGIDEDALVYYPSTPGKYPLITFAHGVFYGGESTQYYYGRILAKIASFGFVVVAMDVCVGVCDIDLFSADQLHIIDAVKYSTNPILKMADASRVGVAGHSWGAIATIASALANRKEVKAAFSLHPCPCLTSGSMHGLCGNLDFKVPIAYFTGSADAICAPDQVESYYDRSKGANKAITNLKGIGHQNPTTTGTVDPEGPYVGAFFRCWIYGDAKGCEAVYSQDSNSMCQQYPTTKCANTYNPSPPPPGPAPPGPAPGTKCEFDQGHDYSGNDIKNVKGTNADDCCTACKQTTGCKAFTWNPYDAQGKKDATCYLKSAAAGEKTAAGMVAGRLA
jgi:dienelactone hydrolase